MLYRITAAATVAIALAAPANAMTMKECSTRYQAAREAGTLKGEKWKDFRKTECRSTAAGLSGKAEPMPGSANDVKEPAVAAAKAPKEVVYPESIDKKFVNESPGRARMHTCLEQYKVNKKNNALGGLKWMQKGGGYYSLCNARLKG